MSIEANVRNMKSNLAQCEAFGSAMQALNRQRVLFAVCPQARRGYE